MVASVNSNSSSVEVIRVHLLRSPFVLLLKESQGVYEPLASAFVSHA